MRRGFWASSQLPRSSLLAAEREHGEDRRERRPHRVVRFGRQHHPQCGQAGGQANQRRWRLHGHGKIHNLEPYRDDRTDVNTAIANAQRTRRRRWRRVKADKSDVVHSPETGSVAPCNFSKLRASVTLHVGWAARVPLNYQYIIEIIRFFKSPARHANFSRFRIKLSRGSCDRPGKSRAPNVADFIAIESAGAMHSRPVVPHHKVAGAPDMAIDKSRLRCMLCQIAQKHPRFGN